MRSRIENVRCSQAISHRLVAHTHTNNQKWLVRANDPCVVFVKIYPKWSSAFEIDGWWIFHYKCMQTLFNQTHSHTWTTDLASIKMHAEPHSPPYILQYIWLYYYYFVFYRWALRRVKVVRVRYIDKNTFALSRILLGRARARTLSNMHEKFIACPNQKIAFAQNKLYSAFQFILFSPSFFFLHLYIFPINWYAITEAFWFCLHSVSHTNLFNIFTFHHPLSDIIRTCTSWWKWPYSGPALYLWNGHVRIIQISTSGIVPGHGVSTFWINIDISKYMKDNFLFAVNDDHVFPFTVKIVTIDSFMRDVRTNSFEKVLLRSIPTCLYRRT